MESFPLFFKIRASTFSEHHSITYTHVLLSLHCSIVCVMLFSFLWLVLLCVEMFARWSVSDEISRTSHFSPITSRV